MKLFWVDWKYVRGKTARAGGMAIEALDEQDAREHASTALASHIGLGFKSDQLEILRVTETGMGKKP